VQTSRFECKYLVPSHKVDAVRRWIQMFVQPDRFAASRPNYTYIINSLYLDSPDYRLYRMTQAGLKNRFKLRIRCYDDNPSSPLFFEIKGRMDRIVRKQRVRVGREVALELLNGRIHPSEVVQGQDRHQLETFLRLMRNVAAGPVTRIRYEREAYESSANDNVRVTLDRVVSYVPTKDWNFSVLHGDWSEVSINGMPPHIMRGTLLEIKFTDYFPNWVAEMIRHHELLKVPFSKYNESADRMLLPLNQACGKNVGGVIHGNLLAFNGYD
jgi:SPX domain protein involved in polyphosphate accumulation